jgi:hypothetical protein
MIKTNNFNVDFTNIETTPFFQVDAQYRIRFGTEVFESNGTKLLADLLLNIFTEEDTISSSFISGYLIKNKRISLKTGLGKILKISNWEDTIVYDPDNERTNIFGTIKGLKVDHLFNYIKLIIKGHKQSYIIFYNEQAIVYVSTDVIDIISTEELINNLKTKYEPYYDREYLD